jgi:hypothetical protein
MDLKLKAPLAVQDVPAANRMVEARLADLQRHWPNTCRKFMGRSFLLPARRQPDYPHYGLAFRHDALSTVLRLTYCGGPPNNGLETEFETTNAWAVWGMSTFFLERELAEALLRTDLPENFTPADLHWRRNALRLFLPRGLFRVDAGHQHQLEPTCATVVRFSPGVEVPPLDAEIRKEWRAWWKAQGWTNEPWPDPPYKGHVDKLLICLQMRAVPEIIAAETYFTNFLLDDRSLNQIAQDNRRADEGASFTLSENAFMTQVRRLMLNAILFSGSIPLEYEPEVIRAIQERSKGRFRAQLERARFLGQELYRPAAHPSGPHQPTGRKLLGHWRAGHWRRQAFGEGGLQRKLIWIQPYKTAGPGADQADA